MLVRTTTVMAALAALAIPAAALDYEHAADAATPSAAPTGQNLPVTRAVRLTLRRAFLRRFPELNPAEVKGPLFGRVCLRDGDSPVCRRYAIKYSRWRTFEWAEARFSVLEDDPPRSFATFKRRVRGRWTAYARYNAAPPIPCPVLRAWKRPC